MKYRARSVSTLMMVVFGFFLVMPMTAALAAATIQTVGSGAPMRSASVITKVLFFVALCVAVFRPAGRITFDHASGTLRYAPSWSMPYLPRWARQMGTEHSLHGLATAIVEANPQGNLYRLVLIYRDGSKRPLTEHFYYGEANHSQVARTLNARIRDQNLGIGN